MLSHIVACICVWGVCIALCSITSITIHSSMRKSYTISMFLLLLLLTYSYICNVCNVTVYYERLCTFIGVNDVTLIFLFIILLIIIVALCCCALGSTFLFFFAYCCLLLCFIIYGIIFPTMCYAIDNVGVNNQVNIRDLLDINYSFLTEVPTISSELARANELVNYINSTLSNFNINAQCIVHCLGRSNLSYYFYLLSRSLENTVSNSTGQYLHILVIPTCFIDFTTEQLAIIQEYFGALQLRNNISLNNTRVAILKSSGILQRDNDMHLWYDFLKQWSTNYSKRCNSFANLYWPNCTYTVHVGWEINSSEKLHDIPLHVLLHYLRSEAGVIMMNEFGAWYDFEIVVSTNSLLNKEDVWRFLSDKPLSALSDIPVWKKHK
jgi:hypothetical protein